MSNDPKPEHRISNLEKEFMQLGSRIEEAASDSAEEFKAVRQEIKQLNDGMMSSFKELGGYFELTEKAIDKRFEEIKATMVTKDELRSELSAMETRLIDAMTRLLQQKSGE